ncbi:MAG: trehalose 6-phosphate phosphorylase [Nitrospirales bacterium]|nr:MAG: trehalose 6-phosphate phosphorylase [Nitrospirales bacterium]
MSDWSLVYEDFSPDRERVREALCTLGNGYFATRGSAPEAEADDIHYPGTYIAGGYNRLKTDIAGRVVENEDLVNFPNWLPLTFRPKGGRWFSLQAVDILSYRQELDLKHGLLFRRIRFKDSHGRRTTLTSRRFVHVGDHHLAGLETTITAENWSGPISIRSALDGRVLNAGVARYQALNSKHLEPHEARTINDDSMYLLLETNQSKLRVAEAARTQFFHEGSLIDIKRESTEEPGFIAQKCTTEITEGQALTVEKIVALHTSRDHAMSECGLAARVAMSRASRFSSLLATHSQRWERLWQRCDIVLDGSHRSQLILRLHIFHLLQTVSPNSIDLDVGVPARGWHGEAYRGHIFWDELFIFPFLNLRIPDITRSLLRYRYRRLEQARWNAQSAGFKGAMYPWQSGSDGREESQLLHLNPQSGRWTTDNSSLQRHVNAAIAYNAWQYYQVTGDWEFLSFSGAEMILEIARFYSSLTTYNPRQGRYEILGVMGPDEYHDRYPRAEAPGLNNNAYTNIMTVWVLCRALEVLDLLTSDSRRELRETLNISKDEIALWEDITHKMVVPFHEGTIISQFDGYDQLEELDWERYQKKYKNIQRLDRILEAEGDTPNRYKVSKQADVLMLFYLFSSDELRKLFRQLGYSFKYETIPHNIKYYLKRTSHGSSLSQVVHAWVAARSDREKAWMLFQESLHVDFLDSQSGTTAEGIHLGAMAGTVDLIQRAHTGLETRGEILYLNPCLPSELKRLSMFLYYRGHSLDLSITRQQLDVCSRTGRAPAIKVGFKNKRYRLKPGNTIRLEL